MAKHGRNDNCIKRRKAGSLASPPMKTRRLSRRGAATLPVRQLTRATCQGRPRRYLPPAPKCRRRDSRKRPRVIRMWVRAHDKQLALPKRTSGRSILVWRPAGREPPSRREPHLAKPTPREDRRSSRLPPANFTMAQTALTRTPCRGVNHGGKSMDFASTPPRCRWWSLEAPHGIYSRYLSRAAEPRTSMFPSSPVGAKDQLQSSQGSEGQPPRGRGSVLPLLRRQTEVEQPPSRWARSAQAQSRARSV
jgi:hypothetical protein